MESVLKRKELLIQWLNTNHGEPYNLEIMPKNASFRRYYRVSNAQNCFIAMDAPPDFENCSAFVKIAKTIRSAGFNVPEIYLADERQGFLLLSDFGDTTLLKALNADNADHYYQRVLSILAKLQALTLKKKLPTFSKEWMFNEWAWHKYWFIHCLLKLPLHEAQALDDTYAQMVETLIKQPNVFMHRDFHAANLMLLPDDQIGILDFQDAFLGPVTYDLASLLRDCYVHWPEIHVRRWVKFYYHAIQAEAYMANVGFETFNYWFDLMSIQRHLKALFTFARKAVRDQQQEYLTHVPRVIRYLIAVSGQYKMTRPLHAFFDQVVLPAWAKQEDAQTCAQ